MTDDTPHRHGLSRRRVLGGLGAIGVASAGAGLGTTAYFSDEESFEENSLTAGELDVKLDYKATYAGGPGRLEEINGWYSDDGPGEPFDVEKVDGEEGTYLIGEVPEVDEGDIWADEVQNTDLCAPDLGLINGDEVPVFTLEDVKPGDSGEVTVSLHICDNPAWMYMNGALTANDENTVTEPEAGVDGENNGISDSPIDGDGELADAIQTKLWYDENCNNVHDGGGDGSESEEVCVQLVIDTSGSMGGTRIENAKDGAQQLAQTILDANPDNKVGVSQFSTGGNVVEPLTDVYDDQPGDPAAGNGVGPAIENLSAGGSTNAQAGVNAGQSDLENCPEGVRRIMVVFGDGDINTDGQAAKDAGTEIFAIGVGGASESELNDLASDPDADHVFLGADDAAIQQLFSQVGQTITGGETVILEDSLANAMAALEEGIALDGDRSTEEDDPFVGGMTHCLGFEWELPDDVGNEVQTDSVGFDLGFYALQARHNDEPPENPFDGNFTDDNGLPSGGNSTNGTGTAD
ncbi:vWA domain-containing protein [Halopenitus sp. POP-27]|uniref:vWA domain-containing protein n=1 Tax=Halopenitus sp. POP-27 TaxID=2994425 RepID=UPI0024689F52|nr:vWA domain-containing protein [Halopenitus sp. POP-27]